MKRKIPHFKNLEDESRFWDTHSITDYLDELKEVNNLFLLSPGLIHKIKERATKKLVSIRLANWEIEKTKEIAKIKKTPYQKLMREWIDRGIRQEAKSST